MVIFQRLFTWFQRLPLAVIWLICCVVLTGIGVGDYFSGSEISFSIFYLLPIAFGVWLGGHVAGYSLSFMGACIWLAVDLFSEHQYSHPLIPYWNSLVRGSFFLIISMLIQKVRALLELESLRADTDPLTGLANRRYFLERMQLEMERLRRYKRSFSFAYCDLDNFKKVNDTLGHETGDLLLCTIAETLWHHFRKTDLVARLGGDEFALLLPETDFTMANEAIRKGKAVAEAMMKKNEWAVSLSIGVVTLDTSPETVTKSIKLADDLMYTVKKHGKNDVRHIRYP